MDNANVVIIGAGLFGTSVAYHLAKRGERDVILMDRLDLATAASSQAAGLMFRVSPKPAFDGLSRVTFKVIEELEERLGESLDFHRVGTLRLAETEAGRSTLEALYVRAQRESISAELVGEDWRAKRLPWLKAGSETLSVFLADEGYIDPYRLATAYARAARQLGVRIQTGMAVKSICMDGDRISGLETSKGIVHCEKIVVAAGVWSNNLTVPLGVSLPMVPTRSHFWISAPDPLFSKDQPMTVHAEAGAYTRPELGGLLLGVRETRSPTFDYRVLPDDTSSFAVALEDGQWDALSEAEPRISRFFPSLRETCFTSYTAGLSAYTPDGHFILGAIENRPGLYVAAGCCGSGVMASGGIGDALAGLILDGQSAYDLAPFRPERFGSVDPASTEFQDRCARARAVKAK